MTSPGRSGCLAIGLAVVATLLAVGCQSAKVAHKTNGKAIVLRFATIDNFNPNGQTVAPTRFIEALQDLSGGQIKIAVQTNYENGAVNAETDIVKAIASGDLDGGWPASRAFSQADIRGLAPIEAPLTLTSYAAQKALITSAAGRTLLGTLDGSGVVGLGLTVGPLRRPWAIRKPLVDLQSWSGIAFRDYNSPVQEDTIRALGAVPVAASFAFADLVQAGRLQGAETDVAQYAVEGYGELLPHAVGNEVLWPKMSVLSLSQKRFDTLTPQQRGWIQGAAQQAVQASVDFAYDETPLARQLCVEGVRFTEATPKQLADLKRAVQPVIDALAHDPVTGQTLAEVLRIAAAYPAPDAVKVPASCRTQ